MLLNEKNIAAARGGDEKTLMKLDAGGLLIAPGEDAAAFATRLERLATARRELDAELACEAKVVPCPGIELTRDARIPETRTRAAQQLTQRLYGLSAAWVPGFFVTERGGALWGGCSLSDGASGLNIFMIRKAFQRRRRWFIYDSDELIAHELCHAARSVLEDVKLEEYFAYQTAHSGLRRYLGNCFIYKADALGFILPIFLLLLLQLLRVFGGVALPIAPFWILAGLYPAWLLARNQMARRMVVRARRRLRAAGVAEAEAVLFRMTWPELCAVAALPGTDAAAWQEWLTAQARRELRWQIIARRFGSNPEVK